MRRVLLKSMNIILLLVMVFSLVYPVFLNSTQAAPITASVMTPYLRATLGL